MAKGCNYTRSSSASSSARYVVVVYGHYVYATCAKKATSERGGAGVGER